jgi:hypothetical protein
MPVKHLTAVLVLSLAIALPALAEPAMQYQQLPAELRSFVEEVHKNCKEIDPAFTPSDMMYGITVLSLEGHRSRDLMMDAEKLCNGQWIKGGNCTNRGCDLKIWKQTSARSWMKVFDEHLYRKFIAVDDGQLKSITLSVYAGDPHCGPDPKKQYSSGQSCDLTVYYRNGNWVWEQNHRDIPVVEEGGDGDAANCSSFKVTGLKPGGDGFLAVRSGPGAQYRKVAELHNGEIVFGFAGFGNWIGIVYRTDNVSCSAPSTHVLRYRNTGWVNMTWLTGEAG